MRLISCHFGFFFSPTHFAIIYITTCYMLVSRLNMSSLQICAENVKNWVLRLSDSSEMNSLRVSDLEILWHLISNVMIFTISEAENVWICCHGFATEAFFSTIPNSNDRTSPWSLGGSIPLQERPIQKNVIPAGACITALFLLVATQQARHGGETAESSRTPTAKHSSFLITANIKAPSCLSQVVQLNYSLFLTLRWNAGYIFVLANISHLKNLDLQQPSDVVA